ncbi:MULTISPECIES: acyl-CoA thioester hydrolase/BAAT C-terminal domain-containing protein [Bacillaceae]|uniref:Acyl-CoA thioesterase/BAAT N-terminal domain-containing protein n=1 Tax=Evansella alkalicola TaxID=745819 RepID=A0ABS6JQM5_9BACI|nr:MULTISPECIES: acyl-CoA thioester hydrolase/BAAT C-terminal domain-containing protein [Bacillaceae]MBU9720853.1 acyl-CoA thioesterase/BAAT N-terminal domain-containing protein [Bacillus alkalicola]
MKCFLYPDIGRVDEPLQLHMNGLKPKEKVNLKLRWEAPAGRWTSALSMNADENGKVTTQSKEVLANLIWKLRPENNDDFGKSTTSEIEPFVYHIDIEATESGWTESRTLTRLFQEDHVNRKNIIKTDFEGSFFYPNNTEQFPVIIVLGFDDLQSHHTAALLASNGYGALQLSYCAGKMDGPTTRKRTVEQVHQAVDWVKENVKGNKNIILYGMSKGAELALLTASKNKDIKGVIAMSPTSHVLEGSDNQKQASPWTEKGQSVPYVPLSSGLDRLVKKVFKSSIHNANTIKQSIEKYDKKGKTDAIIKVENIHGPILLLSGGQDAYWPSRWMAEKIMYRLSQNKFQYEMEHLEYLEAGHHLPHPYMPAPSKALTLALGGDPLDNVVSGKKAWEGTLKFLHDHFPPAQIPLETYSVQI